MNPEAAEVLNALIWAIQEVGAREKIIITSRYEFQFELLSEFWVQGLEAFRKANLEKKLKRLENFNSAKIDKQLIERALKLADGNPRLLEWLDKDVLACGDIDGKLSKLESSSEDWQGKIIWSELYAQIDEKIIQVLSHCLVFKISVPMLTLEAVCESIYGYSDGKFGFSVKKKIYQSLGGKGKYDKEVYEAFGNEVGWRLGEKQLYYSDLTFSLDTHYTGHLPFQAWQYWEATELRPRRPNIAIYSNPK